MSVSYQLSDEEGGNELVYNFCVKRKRRKRRKVSVLSKQSLGTRKTKSL